MARFAITDTSDQIQIYEITSSTVNVGRADSNDLVLAHPSVSRYHARLSVLPGDTTLLIDLGSLNGTLVNGQQIHESRLSDKDRVNIGIFELRYEKAIGEAFHAEAGAAPTEELITPETLSTALRVRAVVSVPPGEAIQQRLKTLEQENKLLKLLLGVGKTLCSVLTPEQVMQRMMELVFQMENVERGFVMLQDEKKGFKPAVVLYKDERLKARDRSVSLSKTLIDRVLTERLPLLIHDVSMDGGGSKRLKAMFVYEHSDDAVM